MPGGRQPRTSVLQAKHHEGKRAVSGFVGPPGIVLRIQGNNNFTLLFSD